MRIEQAPILVDAFGNWAISAILRRPVARIVAPRHPYLPASDSLRVKAVRISVISNDVAMLSAGAEYACATYWAATKFCKSERVDT
jgi:hypothetical protein